MAEAVLVAESWWDEAQVTFTATLMQIIIRGIPLGYGAVIDGIVGPICSEAGKEALYFAVPQGLPEEFDSIKLHGRAAEVCGPEVRMLGAYFISAREKEFIAARGVKRWEEAVEASSRDLFDVERREIV